MRHKDNENSLFTATTDGFFSPADTGDDEIVVSNYKNKKRSNSTNDAKNNSSDKKNSSPHKGHRERVRERYIKHGIESFSEYQMLEFLLFYAFRQGDTNPLAHKLIDKFGSLQGVLRADYKDLIEVCGIKETSASLITLVREMGRYINTSNYMGETLLTTDDVGRFCCRYFSNHVVEEAIIIVINAQRQIQAVEVISKGNETQTGFSPRTIIKAALSHHGCHIIAAHNHPDGNHLPSNQDVYNTNKLIPALREFDVFMIDHIVCAGDKYTSMFEKGYITV